MPDAVRIGLWSGIRTGQGMNGMSPEEKPPWWGYSSASGSCWRLSLGVEGPGVALSARNLGAACAPARMRDEPRALLQAR